MPRTLARAWLPSTEGKPRKSALTIATFVVSSASTRARTVRSPSLLLTGTDGPTPPETGSSGSGVTTRTAMPARNSALTGDASRKSQQAKGTRCTFMAAEWETRRLALWASSAHHGNSLFSIAKSQRFVERNVWDPAWIQEKAELEQPT